jgi:hypothetical protein
VAASLKASVFVNLQILIVLSLQLTPSTAVKAKIKGHNNYGIKFNTLKFTIKLVQTKQLQLTWLHH